MDEFEGWSRWVEPAFLLFKPEDPDYERPVHDPEKAKFTAQEELDRMRVEVNQSHGFDIDFDYYRCVFNYHRAYLDSDEFGDEHGNTGEFLKRLSQASLDDYNKTNETKFEFVKVVKANFHCSAGIMFLITLEAIDPYDGEIKPFQARVRYQNRNFTEYVFCRPKPDAGVEYYGTAKTDEENASNKQRLKGVLRTETSILFPYQRATLMAT